MTLGAAASPDVYLLGQLTAARNKCLHDAKPLGPGRWTLQMLPTMMDDLEDKKLQLPYVMANYLVLSAGVIASSRMSLLFAARPMRISSHNQ